MCLATGISSDSGQLRDQNEDCGHASSWLCVVADGMGGHQAGEVASEITVSTIRNACTPAPIGSGDTDLAHPYLSDLVASVVEANATIFRASLEDPDKQGMGTTVTALSVIVDPTDPDTQFALGLVNVSDSRTYVMRQGRLRQVSEDHSFTRCLHETEFRDRQQTKSLSKYFPRRPLAARGISSADCASEVTSDLRIFRSH